MANELKVNTQLWFSKGGAKIAIGSKDQFIDVSGDHMVHQTQEIGFAAHEALNVGEITTVGWCWFHNMDATNFVLIGYDSGSTFYSLIKLLAGEQCVTRLGQDAPYAQADTGAVDLEYVVVEA